MAEERSRPLEWPVAAIWMTLFVCITSIVITMTLTP